MPIQDDNPIERKLREAWAQQRRFVHTRGAVRLLIWLLALLLADFIIDWFILRGSAGRGFGVLLLLVNVAVLVCVLWYEWLRYLKPYDPLITALDVENRHPELSSLLVSYTQLARPAADQPNVSMELVQAMRVQAATKSKPMDFSEIVDFGQLRNLFLVTSGVILFFAAISINWREHFGTLFQRLAGVDAEYPTETQVTGGSGDLIVRFGDSETVTADASGVIPELGKLFTRPAGETGRDSWKTLPMQKSGGGASYHRTLDELTGDLEYYVRIGDDESEIHRITVVPAPRIIDTKVTLYYPAYMAKEPTSPNELNFEAPEGTEVKWTLTCAPAVKSLEVIADDGTEEGRPVGVEITNDDTMAHFSMLADRAIDYTFRWTEAGSGMDFQYDDVQHSIRVVADSLPEIELLSPKSDRPATVKKKVQIEAHATDDYGLGEAWLVYIVDGSAETRKPIHDFKGATKGDIELTWTPAEDIKELKPGTQISFAIEVKDLYPSETDAHVRRSAMRHISIVEPERYLQWYRSELAAQSDEIKRARDTEYSASAQVKLLREQEDEEANR